jgi:hypothetical protein
MSSLAADRHAEHARYYWTGQPFFRPIADAASAGRGRRQTGAVTLPRLTRLAHRKPSNKSINNKWDLGTLIREMIF